MKIVKFLSCYSTPRFVLICLLSFLSLSSCQEEELVGPAVFVDSVDSLNYFTIDAKTFYHMNVKETTFTSEWKQAFMIQKTTWMNTDPYEYVSFSFSTNGTGTGLFYISATSNGFVGDNYYNRGPVTYTTQNVPGGKTLFKFTDVKIYRDYQKDSSDYFLISGQCTN